MARSVNDYALYAAAGTGLVAAVLPVGFVTFS